MRMDAPAEASAADGSQPDPPHALGQPEEAGSAIAAEAHDEPAEAPRSGTGRRRRRRPAGNSAGNSAGNGANATSTAPVAEAPAAPAAHAAPVAEAPAAPEPPQAQDGAA